MPLGITIILSAPIISSYFIRIKRIWSIPLPEDKPKKKGQAGKPCPKRPQKRQTGETTKQKKRGECRNLLGIQQTQIQRPRDTASALEGDPILDWHEFEIDTLDDGPDLPVGKDGGDIDLDIEKKRMDSAKGHLNKMQMIKRQKKAETYVLEFFLNFFNRVALHYTH